MAIKDLDTSKALSLIDEAETSIDLLLLGLEQLEKTEETDRLHLPLLLLANGFERLFKTSLLLGKLKDKRVFPDKLPWEKGRSGHDIINLLDQILELKTVEGFSRTCKLAKAEIKFIKEDELLKRLLGVLKDFGQGGRYHNFEYILGSRNNKDDPIQKWHDIETETALACFNNSAENKVHEITEASKISFRKIQETIRIAIGVFARIIVTGALGEEGKQLKAFYIKQIDWTKPLIEKYGLISMAHEFDGSKYEKWD